MKVLSIDEKLTPKEEEAEKRFWSSIHHYCFFCKKVTTFVRCGNCLKRFCLSHADEESRSWEEGGGSYPLCYHKECK